jgi:hypothetical protein
LEHFFDGLRLPRKAITLAVRIFFLAVDACQGKLKRWRLQYFLGTLKILPVS